MTNKFCSPRVAPCIAAIFFIAVFTIQTITINGQYTFPPTAAPCPSDSSIVGYTSIADINADMNMELERIKGGEPQAEAGYPIILCPTTTFSAEDGPLTPVLDKVMFMCGNTGEVNQGCIISGGEVQVQVDNPEGVDDSYMFNTMNFVGITFEDFTGRSVDLTADAPLMANFMNTIWQDFDAENIVRIRNNNGAPMDLNIEMANIQSTSGERNGAMAANAFLNEGGTMNIDAMLVENVAMSTEDENSAMFTTTENGVTMISGSTIAASDIGTLTMTTAGTANLENVVVANNEGIDELFKVEGTGSTQTLDRVTVEGNKGAGDSAMSVLIVENGGSASMTNSNVRGNDPITYIAKALTDPADFAQNTSILIEDSNFTENRGTGQGNVNFPSGDPFIDAENGGSSVETRRNNFVDNFGGLANIAGRFGGRMTFENSCFFNNNNFFVTVVLENSKDSTETPPQPSAQELYSATCNYVENELSFICDGINNSEGNGRNSVEMPGAGCFVSNSCDVDCEMDGNDSEICRSDGSPCISEEPSAAPSSNSIPPSIVPSTISQAPSTSSITPSTASITPSTASVAPSTASVAPSTASVAPSTASVAPSTASVAPSTASVSPSTASVAPSTASVAPSTASVSPSTASVAPSTTSVAPSTASLAPSSAAPVAVPISESPSQPPSILAATVAPSIAATSASPTAATTTISESPSQPPSILATTVAPSIDATSVSPTSAVTTGTPTIAMTPATAVPSAGSRKPFYEIVRPPLPGITGKGRGPIWKKKSSKKSGKGKGKGKGKGYSSSGDYKKIVKSSKKSSSSSYSSSKGYSSKGYSSKGYSSKGYSSKGYRGIGYGSGKGSSEGYRGIGYGQGHGYSASSYKPYRPPEPIEGYRPYDPSNQHYRPYETFDSYYGKGGSGKGSRDPSHGQGGKGYSGKGHRSSGNTNYHGIGYAQPRMTDHGNAIQAVTRTKWSGQRFGERKEKQRERGLKVVEVEVMPEIY